MDAKILAFLLGRLLFGGFFVVHGVMHFTGFEAATAATAARGVPLPEVAVAGTGVLLLVGGSLVALGAFPRVGLAFLVVFLVGVTPVMHAFWTLEGQARFVDSQAFLRNLAFLGAALAFFVVPVPWPASVGAAVRRRIAHPGPA